MESIDWQPISTAFIDRNSGGADMSYLLLLLLESGDIVSGGFYRDSWKSYDGEELTPTHWSKMPATPVSPTSHHRSAGRASGFVSNSR